MEAFRDLLPYLAGSAVILLSSLLCITALLEIRSQRRRGVFSPAQLVLIAAAIFVLTVYLIFAADALFLNNTSGTHSPWSDWGFRLGS
jgi:hypothetical protein